MFTSILSFVSLGLLLIVAALVIGIVMALAARKPGSNIVIAQGAVQKLVSIAMSGNVDALVAAAVESIHLHLAEGSLPEKLLQAGFAEVQRNVSNPAGKTPLIDAIALFSGKTRQQVFDVFKAELDGPAAMPAMNPIATPTPAAAVVALLLLALAMPANGADTWGMPVKGPQRFYERDAWLVVDPPLMRDARGQLVEYKQPIGYRIGATFVDGNGVPMAPTQWPQPVYYTAPPQTVTFWNAGPVRRWIARGPVRRWLFRGRC